MRLYLQFAFTAGVLLFAIRVIEMAVAEWPRKRDPKSLGQHLAETVLGVCVTIWAAWLLFAK